jgi:sugar phosphate isomerase/epimerase
MAQGSSYQFSVSEFTTNPWTFEQDVEEYARLGVDAMEVCEIKLDPARIDEQLQLITAGGLSISSVQPQTRTLFPSRSQPEPRDVNDRMARFRATIETFGSSASGLPFVTNTGIPPNGNVQQVLDTARDEYRALADFAAGYGARIALEPLNASIANVETAIWTLEQGMRVVESVDRENFGLCLDFWNIWQNAHIEEAIGAAGDRMFIVQVSDWRTPRSYEDRLIVGQGEIPFPPLLRAVRDSGYQGAYELEIFSHDVPDSLWEGDLQRVIVESRAGLDRAWQEAMARS